MALRLTAHRSVRTLAAVVVLLAGCAVTFVPRAEEAYRDGRYLEAAEDLARHEDKLRALPPPEQARYGRVRGLALLKLGDYEGARRWLDYALEVDRARPSLQPAHRRQIDAGMAEIKQMQQGTGPPALEPKPPPSAGVLPSMQ